MRNKIKLLAILLIALFIKAETKAQTLNGNPADSAQFASAYSNDCIFGSSYGQTTLQLIINGNLVAPNYLFGWFKNNGTHSASNYNYLTGTVSGEAYRSFFAFDLTGISAPITTAQFQTNQFVSSPPIGTVNLTFYDAKTTLANINTDYSVELHNLSKGSDIFNDLGTGTVYGIDPFDRTLPSNTIHTFNLNSAAIAALNSARGGYFTMGARIDHFPDRYEYQQGQGTLTNRAITTDAMELKKIAPCDTCTFALMKGTTDDRVYTRQLTAGSLPPSGLAKSTGSAWATSITDNSAHWNAAPDSSETPWKYSRTGSTVQRGTGDVEITYNLKAESKTTLNSLYAAGHSPTIRTGLGSGQSNGIATIEGTDMVGEILVTTGYLCSGYDPIVEVEFNQPDNGKTLIFLQPIGAEFFLTSMQSLTFPTATALGFTINISAGYAIPDYTRIGWFYHVIRIN